jgi:hypothetical protein
MKRLFGSLTVAIALVSLSGSLHAADYDGSSIEWKLDAGLEGDRFEKTMEERRKAGMRVVDFEQYRSGRITKQAALWVKSMPSDEWESKKELTVTELKKAHEEAVKRGFVIVDVEADRSGATLHFGGVWLKSNEGFETVMQYGMSDLMFSNRYGEMADRGFRLIDFEAYEANGKTAYAAIWKPKQEGETVRFYRGLDKEIFGRVSATMQSQGFRLADIEGYYVDNELTFACGWVSLKESQKTDFAYHMMADEFYQRNANMMMEGYRLTDLEAYDVGRGELRYAGSWTMGEQRVEAEPIAAVRKRDIFKRPN